MQIIVTIVATLFLFLQPAIAQDDRDAHSLAESGYYHTRMFEEFRTVLSISSASGPGRSNPRGWRFGPADRAYTMAVSAFRESLSRDPYDLETNEALLYLYLYNRYHEEFYPDIRDLRSADSLTVAMRSALPQEPKSWIYRGLVLQLMGDDDAAITQFELGKTLMSPTERDSFDVSLSCYQNDVSVGMHRRNVFEDPFLLTPVNEREASHFARLTYADLYYSGWRDTICDPAKITPGEVIVRYGIPRDTEYVVKTQIGDGIAADEWLLLILKTGRHDFTFQKEVPGDWFIHESRIADRTAIVREFPDEGDPPIKPAFDMQFLVSRFRDRDGSPDVVVSAGIPVVQQTEGGDTPLAIITGVFIVDEEQTVIDASVQSFKTLSRNQIWSADTLHVWTDAHELHAAPGTMKIKVEAESEHLVSNNYETIRVDSSFGFSVSDPLLAHWIDESSDSLPPGAISRSGFNIQPAALNLFSRELPVYVYYEIYNLSLDPEKKANYRVEVLFDPINEDSGLLGKIAGLFSRSASASVAASFDGQVAGSFSSNYFILDSAENETGRYLMTLSVTDTNSNEVTQSTQPIILK